ncbi:MAG: sortase [Firmicutes bacterium]|nr:sortase [Bacillota bacterium]
MSNSQGQGSRFNILIILGLLLLAAALCLTVYNFVTAQKAGEAAELAAQQLMEQVGPQDPADPGAAEYAVDPNEEMPTALLDDRYYIGVLSIPALNLELPVQSTWSYPNLRVSPCRYAGSAYTKDLVIAAHNYPRHFGNLKTLPEGTEASFTDMQGHVFHYRLLGTEILDPYAMDYMLTEDFDMTLFTCTIGGATRVTLRFMLADG